ncbi:hypothetical protein [Tabrizicola sp.]|uniref:hypothetical protein n=1 Tax=Tabrizicola sp. TaxID=2005166 RepID=UPI003F2B08C7
MLLRHLASTPAQPSFRAGDDLSSRSTLIQARLCIDQVQLMKTLGAFVLFLVASQGQAACVDFGTKPFLENIEIVQLCIGPECETAARIRSCGNKDYLSADYSAVSASWLFRVRYGDHESDTDSQFAVLRDAIDPADRPLGVVNGKEVWMLDQGIPLDADILQKIVCIPESTPSACDFIDAVLDNLRRS